MAESAKRSISIAVVRYPANEKEEDEEQAYATGFMVEHSTHLHSCNSTRGCYSPLYGRAMGTSVFVAYRDPHRGDYSLESTPW
jgi:hypothetical protein